MSFFIPAVGTFEYWDKWEADMKLKHPIQFFLFWKLPISWGRLYRIVWRDPVYYVKCALWRRHNVIKLRRLTPTWHDRDYLMLHACFQLLEDFVDKEKPWEFDAEWEDFLDDYDDDTSHKRHADWVEIRGLYNWWKNRINDEEDDEKLILLMKYRRYLWT